MKGPQQKGNNYSYGKLRQGQYSTYEFSHHELRCARNEGKLPTIELPRWMRT